MRTRIQKEKAKHRTGMIKNRTGPYSYNQIRKRIENKKAFPESFKEMFGY